MSRRLPKETIEDIRKGVLSGKSKYQVAKELRICETTIYRQTKDIYHITINFYCQIFCLFYVYHSKLTLNLKIFIH